MYQGKNFFLHTVCFLVHTIHRFNYSCIRLATQIWWPLFLLVDTRPEKLLGRNGKCIKEKMHMDHGPRGIAQVGRKESTLDHKILVSLKKE